MGADQDLFLSGTLPDQDQILDASYPVDRDFGRSSTHILKQGLDGRQPVLVLAGDGFEFGGDFLGRRNAEASVIGREGARRTRQADRQKAADERGQESKTEGGLVQTLATAH